MQLEEDQRTVEAGADDTAPALQDAPQEPVEGNEQPAEGDGTPSSEEAAAEAAKREALKPPTPTWMQRRIDELTRKGHEEARRAAALEAELAKLRAPAADEPGDDTRREATPPRNEQEAIRQEAARIVRQQRFDETCNSVFDLGAKEYTDFKEALGVFPMLGGLDQSFLEDVFEAGTPHATLYHLGKNPEEAERIMRLPERGRVVALARLSDKLSAPAPVKPVSKAPAPIAPVAGQGSRNDLGDPDKLSTEEWMRRRNAGEIK